MDFNCGYDIFQLSKGPPIYKTRAGGGGPASRPVSLKKLKNIITIVAESIFNSVYYYLLVFLASSGKASKQEKDEIIFFHNFL